MPQVTFNIKDLYLNILGIDSLFDDKTAEDFSIWNLTDVVPYEGGLTLYRDPTDTTVALLPVLQDTRVRYDAASSNYGSATLLEVIGESKNRRWSYIQFDLDGFYGDPENIILAKIMLYYYYSNWGRGVNVEVRRITEYWEEMVTTWNNKPAHSAIYHYHNYENTNPYGWREFNILPMVKEWVSGIYPNYGTALTRSIDETYRQMSFRSSNYTDKPAQQPYLHFEIKNASPFGQGVSLPKDLSSYPENPNLRILWKSTIAQGTSLIVETAVTNDEVTPPLEQDWVVQTYGNLLSGIPSGSLLGKYLWARVTATTDDVILAPALQWLLVYEENVNQYAAVRVTFNGESKAVDSSGRVTFEGVEANVTLPYIVDVFKVAGPHDYN